MARNCNDVGGPTVKPAAEGGGDADCPCSFRRGHPPSHTEDMQAKETGQFSLLHILPSSFTIALTALYNRVTYFPGMM